MATAVTGTLTAEGQATPSQTEYLLPHAVYFLSEASGTPQVWRLERDGVTQSQITNEAFPVDNFDVSSSDGSVAYVSNNQLYLVNADGSNRRLLVDNAAADREADDFYYGLRISDSRFSPDGQSLAYGQDGVWILNLSTNQAIHLVTNSLMETEGGIFPDAIYSPLAWAPNGQQLLLGVVGQESSTIAFFNPEGDPSITQVESTSIVCCQVAWLRDNSAVLVASPSIGLIEPGLWRFEAETGEQIELVAPVEEEMYQFVGWPLQLADGSLRYFYTSSTQVPANDLPLFMVRSDSDGQTNRVQLRPDSFSNIGEVLWAEDGSLALILQLNPTDGASGTVVLAFSDGRQIQILLPSARDLKWGQ